MVGGEERFTMKMEPVAPGARHWRPRLRESRRTKAEEDSFSLTWLT